ncbi:ABC transporter permease [uncultured Clostridium sp.]|uniref:ABC transporter permease n=1 Tax=uncultured Clostridium sp. TaxID=59620 RepID=UPI0025E8F4C4|nr:ABC transporter permease [uncultured Clostridium sp.]
MLAADVKKNGTGARKRQSQLKGIWRRLKKNKAAMLGLIVIILLIICAVLAPVIAPYGYDDQLLSRRFIFPCREFPFGTDNLGRDILSRVIYGSRISLAVGLVSVSISVVFGTILGSIAGYYGNVLDNVIMRAIDIVLSIPSILLAISIAAMLGQGLFNLMIAIGVSEIPRYARVVRAQILSVKDQEFVEAARAVGASDFHIILFHILPNCLAPMIVQATIGVATAILDAAGLSFIGLGIQPPIPDWGGMLSAGRQYIRDYWYIVTFPGLMIMMTIYSLNLFGDGLRDALDPRLKN